VSSTAEIHYPAYCEMLRRLRPAAPVRSLEGFFRLSFEPGFSEHLRGELRFSPEEVAEEYRIWRSFVTSRIPSFYPGIPELLRSFRMRGGIVAVVSHSDVDIIERDYASGMPGFRPDAVSGWHSDESRRKPSARPLLEIIARFELEVAEVLVLDDLKSGVLMAAQAGVEAAAAGWAHRIPEIAAYMRRECAAYFETVEGLAAFLTPAGAACPRSREGDRATG